MTACGSALVMIVVSKMAISAARLCKNPTGHCFDYPAHIILRQVILFGYKDGAFYPTFGANENKI
jgi:hypothetical protein